MDFAAFFGGSYESRAVTADAERTINWIPEKSQSPGAPSKMQLYPTPGVEIITTITADAPGRAHFFMDGREFAVLGKAIYEFGRGGDVLNGVANDLEGTPGTHNASLPATIHSNGDAGGQLFITSGGNGYTYNLTLAPTVSTPDQVTALNDKAHFGGYLDGYFLALDTSTSTLYVSELYDGTTWNMGTEFAQRSLGQDKWKSMKVVGRAVWLFGEQTTEVWFNTGARFPLSPIPNGVLPFGIHAPHSAAVIGNDVFWLASGRDGSVCIAKASGLTPEVVSTYPLERKMQDYLALTTAVADAYVDSGHSFYSLNFDIDKVTWCFDRETGLWHERGTWIPERAEYISWRPRFYAYAFNEHRMLDYGNGNLYRMSSDLRNDVDGKQIRRMRRAPAIMEENKRVFYSEFELDLETGLTERDCHVGFAMETLFIAPITFEESAPPSPEATITFSTDVTGGSGTYTYLWELLDDAGDPAGTSTDEDGAFPYEQAFCGYTIRVTVTDTVTAGLATKSRGPFSTSTCP